MKEESINETTKRLLKMQKKRDKWGFISWVFDGVQNIIVIVFCALFALFLIAAIVAIF